MGKATPKQPLVTAALLVGCLALSPVFAAPPLSRLQSAAVRPQVQPISASQAVNQQAQAQHLDLRPPAHSFDSVERAAPSFPSMAHHEASVAQERPASAALAADGMRSQSTLQDFAHRVHREGLPVARIFESNSALVHLGLSPRGKPGLWLVQKTH